MKSTKQLSTRILIATAILISAISVATIQSDLNIIWPVLFVAPVFISLNYPNKYFTNWVAIICSLITIAIYGIHQHGPAAWMNLSIIIAGIWTAWFAVINYRKSAAGFSRERERLKALFEYATEGIVIANDRGEIVMINPDAEKKFGYEPEALLGQRIEVLIPERLRGRHVHHRENYTQNPHPRPMGKGLELNGRRKDGSEFPIEISLNNFTIDEGKFVIAFIIDISERQVFVDEILRLNADLEKRVQHRTEELAHAIKRMELTNGELAMEIRERRQAEELLQKNREELKAALEKEKELSELKSRFVTMASHEFRTPLSTILSSASLISKYAESEQIEKRNKHIERIKSSVNNLTSILNEFLSLGKLEEGKVQCHPTPFDIVSFATELTGELKELTRKGQTLIYDHQGDQTRVMLDKNLTRNICINLISNAIKYSQEDQPIVFSTFTNHGRLTISVSDKGIGIPINEQPHVFERFFRANNATNIQGTGLGLNIVRKYTELMQGEISFTSLPGQGTTFMVHIPAVLEGTNE